MYPDPLFNPFSFAKGSATLLAADLSQLVLFLSVFSFGLKILFPLVTMTKKLLLILSSLQNSAACVYGRGLEGRKTSD